MSLTIDGIRLDDPRLVVLVMGMLLGIAGCQYPPQGERIVCAETFMPVDGWFAPSGKAYVSQFEAKRTNCDRFLVEKMVCGMRIRKGKGEFCAYWLWVTTGEAILHAQY